MIVPPCDHAVGRDTVAELANWARARWMVEFNTFRELKDCDHLEHNFGHGGQTLASLMAMFNMIEFLMQSACELDCDTWKAARDKQVARDRMLDHMNHVVQTDCDEVMQSFVIGELPTNPRATPPTNPRHVQIPLQEMANQTMIE